VRLYQRLISLIASLYTCAYTCVLPKRSSQLCYASLVAGKYSGSSFVDRTNSNRGRYLRCRGLTGKQLPAGNTLCRCTSSAEVDEDDSGKNLRAPSYAAGRRRIGGDRVGRKRGREAAWRARWGLGTPEATGRRAGGGVRAWVQARE
jgi:hypothetical protein